MSLDPASPARAEATPIGFNLGAILIVVALVALAFAYGIDRVGRQQTPVVEGSVTRTLAGLEFTIPRAWFRYEDQMVEGFAEQIDLRLSVPLGAEGRNAPVDVALIPRSRARASSRLLDGVYLHRFLSAELPGPPGLVGKPLSGSEGFAGETVWYDALSADPFVAKCARALSPEQPARCLRTVIFDSVGVVYSFDADLLENWRRFDGELELLLGRLGILRD